MLANARLPAPPENDCRPRVLIIEDDGAVARMLRLCLRDAGFDTSEAATGAEALRILQQQPLDATIVDLQLPDGRGAAVLDWLHRSHERATASPVWVVMSALDKQTATERFGPLGSHFFAKPFNPWDIVASLRTLLAARS